MKWAYTLYGVVALVISATVLVWTVLRIATGRFDPREDLPLGLCNLTALIAPIQLLAPVPLLAAWGVCVGGPGGIISILSPDLTDRHDRATHIKFWIVHCGLVLGSLLLAFGTAPLDGSRQLLQLFGALAVLIPLAMLVNRALDANYLFLGRKPLTASPLDGFGRWPVYLVPMFAVAILTIAAAFGLWSFGWSYA